MGRVRASCLYLWGWWCAPVMRFGVESRFSGVKSRHFCGAGALRLAHHGRAPSKEQVEVGPRVRSESISVGCSKALDVDQFGVGLVKLVDRAGLGEAEFGEERAHRGVGLVGGGEELGGLADVVFAVGDEGGGDALAAVGGVGDEELDEGVAEEMVVKGGEGDGVIVRIGRRRARSSRGDEASEGSDGVGDQLGAGGVGRGAGVEGEEGGEVGFARGADRWGGHGVVGAMMGGRDTAGKASPLKGWGRGDVCAR